ncbi:succinate dehydrogenase cytochrome b subunit [Plebeiibacterium marinum]|uniref:Succinate dehydrogenase cytochrome b subunit n=1 Tax=Plebeiibacterium marinum TaxID=2992111 RepID=A0AAE3MG71_9BACT|nr:succinate dehydrogenase cytochrome b subunit [Plebeiobacterium marinum]MCW3806881.1 succinate dehydrogenase cytochrome b subunit [Plebeiobacterium marinum]
MSNLFCSSIGRKLLMSLSGLFLIIFLIVHLSINLLLLVPDNGEAFNVAANFMALPVIKFGLQPVLALGFIVHIAYGAILTAQNNKARGNSKYASGNKTKEVMWASKNMFVLGITVFAFLAVHLVDYWVPLQITHGAQEITIGGVTMHDTYGLVKETLQNPLKVALYIIGSLGLAIHLTHGFWSAFQTLGASNSIWRKRWTVIGTVFAWVVSLGFCVIAITMFLS